MAEIKLISAATAALAALLALGIVLPELTAAQTHEQTYRSPAFTLGPGDVADKIYSIEMPKGHVALRSFNAQLVDKNGVSIPLYETYLHHWTIHRHYRPSAAGGLREDISASNWGPCGNGVVRQLYGLGSETRKTDTMFPAPYGLEIGNEAQIPPGYTVEWELNVHAIDTRGAIDANGCTECLRELYKVDVDSTGKPLPADYKGGLECCYDSTHCPTEPGYVGETREVYMEYYVSYVDMSTAIVPVKIYIFDVSDGRTYLAGAESCKIEYDVPKCADGETKCIHTEENVNFIPGGGALIYATAHQHTGGLGAYLYREDGTEITSSIPIYGVGTEAGNEEGWIVGMTVDTPEPGSVIFKKGEKVRVSSVYKNDMPHIGVMCLYYLVVDESQAPPAEGEGGGSHGINGWWVGLAVLVSAALFSLAVHRHTVKQNTGQEYQRTNV